MHIELHVADAVPVEAYDQRDRPIKVVVPDVPRRVASFTVDEDVIYLGRFRDYDGAGVHRPWPVHTDDSEDQQLSREQLMLDRRAGVWHLSVPGTGDTKLHAVAHHWGTDHAPRLRAGSGPIALAPGVRVSTVVATKDHFYWALISVPKPADRNERTTDLRRRSARETLPFGHSGSPLPLPDSWEEAVLLKYRPFLTWPMAWKPRLVPPGDYPDPTPEFLHQHTRTTGTGTPRERHANWVKKKLRDVTTSAVSRGHQTATPNEISVALLEFLVDAGDVRFADHHCRPLSTLAGARPGSW